MDAGPERPAETPRSSASAEGFDEVCDAPVGGIGPGIQDGHMRFVSRARIQIDVFEQLRKEFKVAAGVTRLFPKPRYRC
jgi:hypothetical protein